MSVALGQRPAPASAGDGGVPARRAMLRWAWRLFRREWRQQFLVLALITVAVAATILGAAVGTNTPSSPSATFGYAGTLVTLPGSDPTLAADIASIRQQAGAADVIENQNINTGSVDTIELRAQDPSGPYGSPTLSLVAGHFPTGPAEVALTQQVATLFNLRVGGTWQAAGQTRTVVGLVENPGNLLDEFALVAPGQITSPTRVSILVDAPPAAVGSFQLPTHATVATRPRGSAGLSPALVVLLVATFGLIFIGLVAVAGFTVTAQRRMRSFGMLSSLGATDRNIRLVMVGNGAAIGVVATLIGAVLGFVAWFAYAPRLQTITAHRVDPFNLPWWAIGTAMCLAVVTAILAADRPARGATRIPVVAALSGRPPAPRASHRSALPGVILLAIGLVSLAFSGGWGGGGGTKPLPTVGGLAAATIGGLLFAPLVIAGLAAAGARTPIGVRLALRDLVRYRARSGAALSAISLAVVIAVVICIGATSRYADPLDYVGPNLPANQVLVRADDGSPDGPGAPPQTPAQTQSSVQGLATAIGAGSVLELDSTAATLRRASTQGPPFTGQVYVATPAVLRHYGIVAGKIDPNADILTSRVGLASVANLQLFQLPPTKFIGPGPGGSGPNGPGFGSFACDPGTCVAAPKIQTLSRLPLDASDPNVLITTHAMQTLGLQAVPSAWVAETARPLTPLQISTARELAVAAGLSIETKAQNPSLSQLRNWVSAAGMLLALGVLAMTVGLIRSETAGDLRILTATGAGSTIRRTLTGATAGALALLGALLGTALAYLECLAFYRSSLSTTISHVPVADLIAIVAGLPVLGAIGGWLFAGREPAAIARQPLD